jgi:hypothetical protein
MTTTITIITAGLSILTPILFLRLIMNIQSTNPQTNRLKTPLAMGIAGWAALMWLLGSTGVFSFEEGDTFPKFLIALFVPVTAFLLALTQSSFRRMIDHLSLKALVGFQFWRIFGAVFFLVALAELGPYALMGSGYGDLITGSLAIIAYFMLRNRHSLSKIVVWAFMAVGIMDLLVILYILLAYYPLWSEAVPSSALAGSFPMILVVGVVAPIALIFHVLTLRKLIFKLDRT